MAVDGSLKFDTKIDTGGFNKGVDGIKQSCSSMMNSFKKIGASVGVAFGVGAVVQFSKASIKASNDIENAMIGLKSILDGQGRDFQQADKFMQAYISDGLIPATEAVTAYKNLAMRGYTDPQIQSTLLALKDSAAFGRQASLTMGQAVAGATEGLKNENSILVDNAGVTKNVSMMWADYAKSIGIGVAQLTKEQKIQAEVLGVMEETRFQTGDAAKVADTYSGSILKLQFGMNNVKIAFGNFIKPIVASVIPVINAAIETFTRFFNVMSQVSALLFGKKVFAEEQAQKQENALGGAVQNEKDLAKATEKANKASKKQLSDFDKIHVLARETADSIDTGSGNIPTGGGTGNTIDSTVEVSPKVAQAVEKIRAMLEPLSKINLDNLKLAFVNFKAALEPFTSTIFEGLKWAWDTLLVPLGKWVIEDTVPTFLAALSSALGVLNAVIEPFKPLGKWLWEDFLKPIAMWTGDLTTKALEDLKASLDNITIWCKNNKDSIKNITITVLAFFAAWKATELMAFIQTSGGVIGVLKALKTAIWSVTGAKIVDNAQTTIATIKNAGTFLASIISGTVALVKQAVAWVALTVAKYADEAAMAGVSVATVVWNAITSTQIAILIKNIAQWVISTASKVADTVAQWAMIAATTTWNGICGIATAVTTAFGAAVAFLTSPIVLVILAIGAIIAIIVLLVKNWDWVKATAISCWEWIKKTWESVANWFDTNVVQPVGKFFSALWDGVAYGAKMLWYGIQVGAISTVNFVISAINAMIDGILAPFNLLIDAMNLLPKVEIPNIDFNIPTIKLPPMPHLAAGAVIPPNREFMAVLGDQRTGTNIEAPLDTMVQAFKMANADSGSNEIVIKFTGALSELVRILKPELDKESNRKGTRLVMG